jgi:maltose alpha-D-glucosyltransferase/alpha-amylase
MHLALASRADIPEFAPEPFTPHYQRAIYQFVRAQASKAMQLLRRRAKDREDAQELLRRESAVQQQIRAVLAEKIGGQRIRVHGDYHLGQVLHSANDFFIIDFEGEPARPLSERRIKRSALRDVAGMLRSFHYAPHAVISGQAAGTVIRPEDIARLEAGATFWHRWVAAAFLRAYLQHSDGAAHLPGSPSQVAVLLNHYLIEKALYEIAYELDNRPDWVHIPIRGMLDLVGTGRRPAADGRREDQPASG